MKYLDGETESHVHAFRLRIASNNPPLSQASPSSSSLNIGYNSNYSSDNLFSIDGDGAYDSFIPDDSADIDAWLENECDGDIDPPKRTSAADMREKWLPEPVT